MHFLIDGNLPRSLVQVCERFGHQAVHVRDSDLSTAADERIAAHLRDTGAALLTRDMDFADVRRYPPSDYEGIIVLRLQDDVIASDLVEVVELFLRQSEFVSRLPGHLVILEADRFRFRPALR